MEGVKKIKKKEPVEGENNTDSNDRSDRFNRPVGSDGRNGGRNGGRSGRPINGGRSQQFGGQFSSQNSPHTFAFNSPRIQALHNPYSPHSSPVVPQNVFTAPPAQYRHSLVFVYMVHFKHRISEYLPIPSIAHTIFAVGNFVIVSSEPFGEDLGVIVEVLTTSEYHARRRSNAQLAPLDRNRQSDDKAMEHACGRILRMGNLADRQKLPQKNQDEEEALQYCQHLVTDVIRTLDMTVFSAEFTIDRRKLTFYYHSEQHVDFRELVKDMFNKYKTRIWMKKTSQEATFHPVQAALLQLSTGQQI
eukprot:gene37662-46461_t